MAIISHYIFYLVIFYRHTYMLYLYFIFLFPCYYFVQIKYWQSKESAEMWAFATFKSPCPIREGFFFLQNNHRFFLAWLSAPLTPLAVGFFLIVEKSDTDRSRAFLSPQITRERCGTRFVDKLELSARRTSIVISIASVHSLAQYSRAVVRTHGRVCGYMWIYSVRGVYFGAPTAKPQTRGLARPNLKPKPTLLPRG